MLVLLLACATSSDDSATLPDCDARSPALALGSFPDGTLSDWLAYEDGDALCFRTGPCGNGSAWPEIRVTNGSGTGHVTARLVRDGEVLYETRYDEVMSRPADDLCSHTTHFYLWLPDSIVRSFDGGPATLAALYEEEEILLQDAVEVRPVVCNPEGGTW